jgi:hypothetical protein
MTAMPENNPYGAYAAGSISLNNAVINANTKKSSYSSKATDF